VTEGALNRSNVGALDNHKVKVLYVAGWGRSGSTILGRILGQVSNFFLVGELRYVWDRGLIENRLCSCGVPFRECQVWQEIMAEAFGDDDHVEAQRLIALRERELRTRHLLTPTISAVRTRVARMGEYQGTLEKLYRAVRDVRRSRVVVDTSKFPSYGYILQRAPGIELYVLHLVRDPRAVAYSWESRKKPKMDRRDGPSNSMTPHGFVESSLVWDVWNLAIENVWRRRPERYMLLRYEDFVESPRNSVQSILRFLGEEAESPFVGEREIAMEVPHTFSGNPDRFQSGTLTIRPDEGWRRNMSVTRQGIVTTLTWPGLVRYGYPLWPQRQELPGASQDRSGIKISNAG
jgi:hypothetical protein